MRSVAYLALVLTACDGALLGELPLPGTTPPGTVPPVTVTPPLPPPDPEEELPEYAPGRFRARVLLAAQYRNAVEDLLGPEAAAAVTPLKDVPVNGLTAVGASVLAVSGAAVDRYEENAYLAAQTALRTRRGNLIPCTAQGFDDAACMQQVASRLVPRAFRRPATSDELTRWTQVALEAARAYEVFDRGVEFLAAGLLQSPQFLYLAETGEAVSGQPERRQLTGHQLASRLSFFLTAAPPDDELLAAAASGALDTEAGLRSQARRLLELPKARAAMADLFEEVLELNHLPYLSKDAQKFPGFQLSLTASMREETRRTLVDVAFERPADFRTVLTRPTTFVDGPLAQHYGLPPVSGWQQVTTNVGRAGILTQAAFLSLMAHPSSNSPTYRGRFIRERLLCQGIPAPPPEVSTTLPEPPPGVRQTLRMKVEQHMQAPSCRGCHQLMDPPGFAFEGFDAVGREQTHDDGLPVDTTGELDELGTFADAEGLMGLLFRDKRVTQCFARQVFRQGAGRVELLSELRALFAVEREFAAAGYRYKDLLVALVTAEAFRTGTMEAP